MKRVEAVISPVHQQDVADRLRMIGVRGMTVQQIAEVSPEMPPQTHVYRGGVQSTDLFARVRIDVVVEDDMVEPVMRAIITVVKAGGTPSGRIRVVPVLEVIRISTGEHGTDAL